MPMPQPMQSMQWVVKTPCSAVNEACYAASEGKTNPMQMPRRKRIRKISASHPVKVTNYSDILASKPFSTPCVSRTNARLFSLASESPSVSTASSLSRTSFMIVSLSFLCSKSFLFGSCGGAAVNWTQRGRILV